MDLTIPIALTGFLILLFAYFSLSVTGDDGKKEHVFLRLLLIIFFLQALILIGKAGTDNCSIVNVNQTVVDNTTFYSYEEICVPHTKNTSLTFFKLTQWLNRLFWIYIIVYLTYVTLKWKGVIKTKRQ